MTLYMPAWKIENSKRHTLHHTYYSVPSGEDFTTHGYLSSSSLWKSCMSFSIFVLVAVGRVFIGLLTSAWPLWMNCSNGRCILLLSASPGSEVLSTGKWTKHYDWSTSLNYQSWLAVAQPQENASCRWTLPLSYHTCTHRHENDHFIIAFTFFGIMISSWA